VYQYYWYTGDESCIKEHLPTILKILRWFLDYQDLVTGLITNVPQWIFIDWSENDKWGACGALNAQVYHTLEIVLEMIRIVNWIPLIEELIPIARNITEGINQYLWDEKRQAYVDAVAVSSEGKVVKKSSKITFQTNAWILLFDIAPIERRDQVFASVFDQPLSNIYVHNRNPIWTSLTPKKYDPDTHIVMAEPFFMHQVNQLFNKRERSDLLTRYLYEGWGAMIKKGASTIWETWSDGGSLCHAWSTSPAYDLVSYVLGVEFSLPGAEEVQLTPHILDLTWAEGIVPTIKGPIHIRWDWNLEEKALIVKYSAPSGVNMILSPPLFNNQPHRVVKPLEIHGRGENIFRIDY
jgi:alpha-L-rhamnosidase